MKKTINKLFLLLALGILFGCSHMKYFSNELKIKYNFTNSDLKNVQYYIDKSLVLELSLVEAKSNVDKSKVSWKKNIYEKRILIDEDTPGIAYRIENDKIFIKFDNDLVLGFKPDNYSLMSKYYLFSINDYQIKDGSKIKFRNQKYIVRYGKYSDFNKGKKFKPSGIPSLLYEFSSALEEKLETEKIKGMKL